MQKKEASTKRVESRIARNHGSFFAHTHSTSSSSTKEAGKM